MLDNWDFSDESANSGLVQENRQKSATNLIVVSLDRSIPSAVFADPKRRQEHAATLNTCTCHDFNFVGKSPRKTLAPCMHIYRLAMELGLLVPRFIDADKRQHAIVLMKNYEVERLQQIPPDAAQWGEWSARIHESGIQRNRQYRAYFILDDEREAMNLLGSEGIVRGYKVSLTSCQCPDFSDHRLPCKHIYAVALVAGIALPFSRQQYLLARSEGKDVVFRYEDA